MQKDKEINPVILSLTIDSVFKMYFEDPRNENELRRFLKVNLELDDDDLSKIKVLNPGLPKDHIKHKKFTVDLLLKTKSGNDIHIEMQTNPHGSFNERIQLYNARKAGQQIRVGKDYHDAKRTISLIITDFRMFDDNEVYHERIIMRRENGKVFTDVQEINIIDLTKLGSEATKMREKYLWGKLFKIRTREELEMLAQESEEMAQATEKLLEVSADEIAQAYALSRASEEYARKADEYARKKQEREMIEKAVEQGIEKGIKQGIKQGIEQGIEKGIEQGKLEIAENLLAMGMSIEDVSKGTGLSTEMLK